MFGKLVALFLTSVLVGQCVASTLNLHGPQSGFISYNGDIVIDGDVNLVGNTTIYASNGRIVVNHTISGAGAHGANGSSSGASGGNGGNGLNLTLIATATSITITNPNPGKLK